MKSLEYEGIYDLVIPGQKMPECKQLPQIYNSSARLFNLIARLLHLLAHLAHSIYFYAYSFLFLWSYSPQPLHVHGQQTNQQTAERIRNFNHEWRSKNSHCFYFGIYSFNLTKWKSLDSSKLRTWCNSTASSNPGERHYLAGYIRHSNMIMLIVDDEFELFHCGNMSEFMQTQRGDHADVNTNSSSSLNNQSLLQTTSSPLTLSESSFDNNSTKSGDDEDEEDEDDPDDIIERWNRYEYSNGSSFNMTTTRTTQAAATAMSTSTSTLDFTINRYRKKPDVCYNYFDNERDFLPCHSDASRHHSSSFFTRISRLIFFIFIFSLFYFL